MTPRSYSRTVEDRLAVRSVRATNGERSHPLAGDRLIDESAATLTHAITIGAAPADVWPWLVQMGAGARAGWYSYDRLDNGGERSAERIVAGLQTTARDRAARRVAGDGCAGSQGGPA
jgi:hypothetical protein